VKPALINDGRLLNLDALGRFIWAAGAGLSEERLDIYGFGSNWDYF